MQSDLFLVHHPVEGQSLYSTRLKLGDWIIGRTISTEIDISIPLETVSRRHAMISVAATGAIVTDLGSRNGTWVNGTRVLATPVFPGQQIHFGVMPFVVTHDPRADCGTDSEEETRDVRTVYGTAKFQSRPLTPPVARVFELLVQGLLEREIAEKLFRSVHTIHNHTRAIYQAYEVNSRVELLLKVMPRPGAGPKH